MRQWNANYKKNVLFNIYPNKVIWPLHLSTFYGFSLFMLGEKRYTPLRSKSRLPFGSPRWEARDSALILILTSCNKSRQAKKKAALRREELKKEYEQLKKLGKL